MRRASTWSAVLVAVAVVVLVTSCEWRFARFDAANTNASTSEWILTTTNVNGLHEEWTSTTTAGPVVLPPIVICTLVIVASTAGLEAFDAAGVEGCGGVPKTCTPVWTAPGWTNDLFALGAVVIASGPTGLRAFDPAGTTGCSGTPRVCEPVWTSPQVAGTGVAAGSEIFAPGQLGSGTDVITAAPCAAAAACPPLRTYVPPCNFLSFCRAEYTSLSGDDLVVASYGRLGMHAGTVAAFDRTSAGCSGTPVTCPARWETFFGDPFLPPVVSEGTIYQAASIWCSLPEECSWTDYLAALDQATGAKKWTHQLTSGLAGLAAAGGWLHEGRSTEVVSYRDAGACTTTCPSHHRSRLGGSSTFRGAPVVANGMLFVGTSAGVAAFDAAGVQGCSPAPIECSPLVHVGGFQATRVVVAAGNVWAFDTSRRLHVLGLD